MTIADSPWRTLRILIADNSLLNRRILTAMLDRRGHVVQAVETGREVLSELLRGSYDVLLMDVAMPEMDGVEVASAIRSSLTDRVDASIPIVALASGKAGEDRERFIRAGVDGLLLTPVRVTALLQTVRDVMQHKGRQVVAQAGEQTAQKKEGRMREFAFINAEFGLDQDDIRSLYDLVRQTLPREFSALKIAVEESWLDEVAEVAHSLAGSALDIISEGPALVVREMEYAARCGDAEEVRQLFVELEPQIARVHASLERMGAGF